jgi:hypothetical protein
VAVVGVAALVAICVVAIVELWQMAQFQLALEAHGFIILDDPLAVCIQNCHSSSVRLPNFREFPEPETDLSPRYDVELPRRWIEGTPNPTREESGRRSRSRNHGLGPPTRRWSPPLPGRPCSTSTGERLFRIEAPFDAKALSSPRTAARCSTAPAPLRGHVLNRCPVPSSPSAPRTPK